MPKKNVFQTHPKGAEVLEELIRGEINQRQAAQKLQRSEACISQLLKKYPKWASKKDARSISITPPSELIQMQKDAMGEFTLKINADTPMEALGPLSWRAIWQGLLMMSERQLEPQDYVKVANVLMKMMQYEFKEGTPQLKQKEILLDKQTEDRLIKRLEAYCEQCPFHRTFIERKAQEQSRARLQPTQSTSLGRSIDRS